MQLPDAPTNNPINQFLQRKHKGNWRAKRAEKKFGFQILFAKEIQRKIAREARREIVEDSYAISKGNTKGNRIDTNRRAKRAGGKLGYLTNEFKANQ